MTTSNWDKIIAHVDMDAFFASVEQVRAPHLMHKPVVIQTNPKSRTVIAASYEARALGARVGDPAPKHPSIHVCYADHRYYAHISQIIMRTLNDLCPSIEVFSIDEAYLDLSGMHYIYPEEQDIITTIKHHIFKATGLTCSIGIAENKPLAKLASSANKPNGHLIIPPGEGCKYLYNKPIDILCGIGPKMTRFLNQHQVYVCQDITKIPISVLSSRFGQIGREIWYMCQGLGSNVLRPPNNIPKSMGNSKCIEPRYYQHAELLEQLDWICQKFCARLREKQLYAQQFTIILTQKEKGIVFKFKTTTQTHYHDVLKQYYHQYLKSLPTPLYIRRVAIRTSNLYTTQQNDILDFDQHHYEDAMDKVKEKFGNECLQFANQLDNSKSN